MKSRCQSRHFFTASGKTRNRYFLQLLETIVEQISTLHTWRTPCKSRISPDGTVACGKNPCWSRFIVKDCSLWRACAGALYGK